MIANELTLRQANPTGDALLDRKIVSVPNRLIGTGNDGVPRLIAVDPPDALVDGVLSVPGGGGGGGASIRYDVVQALDSTQQSTAQNNAGGRINIMGLGFGAIAGNDGANVAVNDAAMASAIALAAVSNAKIVIPGYFRLSAPITWYCKRFSIEGEGRAALDFTSMPSNVGAAVQLFKETDGSYTWQEWQTSFKGLRLIGTSAIDCFDISGSVSPDTIVAGALIEHCYINVWRRAMTFGNKEWLTRVNHCHFRACVNAVYINKTIEACENQLFENCTFNGCTGYTIKMVTGSSEFTFNNCSFDYGKGDIEQVASNTRAVWKFHKCHFEADGTVLPININESAGSAGVYLTFDDCDWIYLATKPVNLAQIAGRVNLVVRDGVFPFFTSTDDRSSSVLFVPGPSATGAECILIENPRVEKNINIYYQRIARVYPGFPAMTAANVAAGGWEKNQGTNAGTVTFTAIDSPSWNADAKTIVGTENANVTSSMPLRPGVQQISISGNIKCTPTGLGSLRIQFYTQGDLQISQYLVANVPGQDNSWKRFGTSRIPVPPGTAYVKFAVVASGVSTIYFLNDIQIDPWA